MKKLSAMACVLGAALMCAVPVSIQWSPQKTPSLSVDSAIARIGRPLTPLSGAGVADEQFAGTCIIRTHTIHTFIANRARSTAPGPCSDSPARS